MGWLRWVGYLKIHVSLQNIGLFCRALLQKRPIFLRILLIVATPYQIVQHTDFWGFWTAEDDVIAENKEETTGMLFTHIQCDDGVSIIGLFCKRAIYIYIYICYLHTYTYTGMLLTHIHIHRHTYTYTDTHTHTQTHIHIHRHTYTYTDTHTHTQTHIHIHRAY